MTTAAHLTLVSFGGWFPVLCTNDRQADLSLLVNVGVVDLRFECDLGWFERVFCREDDLDPERPFVIWRVVLWERKVNEPSAAQSIMCTITNKSILRTGHKRECMR